jgi:hypothetical protein
LDWLLSQEEGDYVVVVIASDNQSNHVVGFSISRAVIFDHEMKFGAVCPVLLRALIRLVEVRILA